jgi:integrase/recombinase XerD
MAICKSIPLPTETVELLKRFTNHLYARCGLAESTIGLVTGYIRRMIPELGAHPTPDALDQYVADLRRRKVSYGNLANCLTAIEHYMAFLGEPIKFGRPARPSTPEIKVLSEGKVTLIIAAANTLRKQMIMMILAYTGIRNRELIGLRIGDVDVAQQTITVQAGKGEKGRVCPMSGDCVETLSEYLRERNGQPNDFLFVTKRHRHQLQTQDIRKITRVIAAHIPKRHHLPERVWPHLFRHSLATAMLDRGASVYSIQAILGHAFVSTTMDYYLHPGNRNVRADYHRCAPSFV